MDKPNCFRFVHFGARECRLLQGIVSSIICQREIFCIHYLCQSLTNANCQTGYFSYATNLYFDRQHNLWIGSTTGLVKIDTAGNANPFTEENGLPVNIISSVLQDNENTMWFINEQTGICKLTSSNLELYKDVQKGFFLTDIYAGNSSDSLWLLDAGSNQLLLKD